MPHEPTAPAPARDIAELAALAGRVDVVAIGASAGGVEALATVAATLPADLTAAVLVVLHVSETGTSVMPAILDRAGPLPAASGRDGETIVCGRVYVAPPGHHMTLDGARLQVAKGPRENGHRPAIDPLMRTLARSFGPRAAGVILTGARDDGTAGLRQIEQRAGIAIAQEPATALYPSMPSSAIDHVAVDAILPLIEIGPALTLLAGRGPVGEQLAPEPEVPTPAPAEGLASRFTCPECGGVLVEFRDGSLRQFRCSVGHSLSFETLVELQSRQLESALWAAARALEDRALLLRRMERDSRARGHSRSAAVFEGRARIAADQATAIREVIERGSAGAPPLLAAAPGAAVTETMRS